MHCLLLLVLGLIVGLASAQPSCGTVASPNAGPLLPQSTLNTNLDGGDGVPFAVFRPDVEQTRVFFRKQGNWMAATSDDGTTFDSISEMNVVSTDVAVSVAFLPAQGIFLIAYRRDSTAGPSNLYVADFLIASCSGNTPCQSLTEVLIGPSIQTPTLINLSGGDTALMWLSDTGVAQISTYSSNGWSSPSPLWLEPTVEFDGAVSVSSDTEATLWAAHAPAAVVPNQGNWLWAQYLGPFCGAVQASTFGSDVVVKYSQSSIIKLKESSLLIFASRASNQLVSRLSYARYTNNQWTEIGYIGNIYVVTAPSGVIANDGRAAVYYFTPNKSFLQVTRWS